jgi:hypothetical protein
MDESYESREKRLRDEPSMRVEYEEGFLWFYGRDGRVDRATKVTEIVRFGPAGGDAVGGTTYSTKAGGGYIVDVSPTEFGEAMRSALRVGPRTV